MYMQAEMDDMERRTKSDTVKDNKLAERMRRVHTPETCDPICMWSTKHSWAENDDMSQGNKCNESMADERFVQGLDTPVESW